MAKTYWKYDRQSLNATPRQSKRLLDRPDRHGNIWGYVPSTAQPVLPTFAASERATEPEARRLEMQHNVNTVKAKMIEMGWLKE